MDKKRRIKNEKEFDTWEELPGGGRKYWFDVKGKLGGFARYIKITDAEEQTVSFVQEIYDKNAKFVSIHEKYPLDKGHKKI
ncbi:MAG: hypothetical protein HY063_04880 [Bacteroidetes bacterium]|nr:hypothetical protein [Bacteroidota bacterium]